MNSIAFLHLENIIAGLIIWFLLLVFAIFILCLAVYVFYKGLNPKKVEMEHNIFESEDEKYY